MDVIKSYKGFNKDMTCCPGSTPFQYEEGAEYEESSAQACDHGFHACEMPLDVFKYYEPAKSVYHEVEQSGELSRSGDDSKVASSKIKIGARLDIAGLVKAQIEYVKSHTTMEHTDPDRATAGYRGAATAGNCGAATSRGKSASGKNGISVARGNNVRVKGGIGAILVIAEEKTDNYDIVDWKAVVVDGEKIKANTWYKLENGELVEVEE